MDDKKKYFEFLDQLKISGTVNMLGSSLNLEKEFPELTHIQARDLSLEWMMKEVQ